MPLRDSNYTLMTTSVVIGGGLMAALMHAASLAMSGKKLRSRGAYVAHLFVTWFAGAALDGLLLDYAPFSVTLTAAWAAAGVLGFVYGPAAMYLLANFAQSWAAQRMGVQPQSAAPPAVAVPGGYLPDPAAPAAEPAPAPAPVPAPVPATLPAPEPAPVPAAPDLPPLDLPPGPVRFSAPDPAPSPESPHETTP